MLLKFALTFLLTASICLASNLERYRVPKNFQTSFEQERFIKSTDLRLKSGGDLKIINGAELFWHQKIPFEHMIVMTKDSIKSGETGDLKPVKEPMAKYMAKIMFNLFNGSIEELKTLFKISEGSDYLLLRPKDKTMAKFIEHIRVEGSAKIEEIRLSEKSGNYLFIEFDKKNVK